MLSLRSGRALTPDCPAHYPLGHLARQNVGARANGRDPDICNESQHLVGTVCRAAGYEQEKIHQAGLFPAQGCVIGITLLCDRR